ncbi:MAG: DsbA family protein [Burkholderiaceae bacterium]|nr:DsbA family protein [Burkholderiaceae bacterium]MDH3459809.1 DsbA family protein [Burkholderiaceae bacterium]
MKHLRFYFDIVSPYAYLAFERLPCVLEGLSYEVSYQAVERAGLPGYRGDDSSSAIEMQQAREMANRYGLELSLPAPYPFSPVALLCLALASAREGYTPSRYVCKSVLHHVWRGGGDVYNAQRSQALNRALKLDRDAAGHDALQTLRVATADAAARGVFNVPTGEVDGQLFWGLDCPEGLAAYMRGDAESTERSPPEMDGRRG